MARVPSQGDGGKHGRIAQIKALQAEVAARGGGHEDRLGRSDKLHPHDIATQVRLVIGRGSLHLMPREVAYPTVLGALWERNAGAEEGRRVAPIQADLRRHF